MPMAGKGMLLTSMDIDAADEAEFNRWYDREHLEERVAIEGFLEARRYIADETYLRYRSISVSVEDRLHVTRKAFPKYLSLYSTETFDVLDSPAYRQALANQTDWSKANIGRFKNMIRAVGRITISRGQGRGAVLGIVRLRPAAGSAEKLRAELRDVFDPQSLNGVISMHLIESDPTLSRPLTDNPSASDPGAGDWFVLIDATDVNAATAAAALLVDGGPFKSAVISAGVYRLMWDLAKSDIPA
jgi:hypothetical protein